MRLSATDLKLRGIACLEIDGCAPLTDSLVNDVHATCDDLEDGQCGDILLLRIKGRTRLDAVLRWPGPVSVPLVNRWEGALRRIERLEGVSMAVVGGVCSAGALELLLATDYRLAVEDMRVELRHDGEPIWPGMLLYRLANQLGLARARALGLFTQELCAEQALELGVVDDVSADAGSGVEAFLESVGSMDLSGLPHRRLLLLEAVGRMYEDALGTHLAACDRVLRSSRSALGDAGINQAETISGRARSAE